MFASITNVNSNLNLPTAYLQDNTTISWATSDKDAITSSGVYGTPNADVNVTLTATVTCESTSKIVTYEVTALRYYSDLTDGVACGYFYGSYMTSASDASLAMIDVAYISFGYIVEGGVVDVKSIASRLNAFVTRCHQTGTYAVLSIQETKPNPENPRTPEYLSDGFTVATASNEAINTFVDSLIDVINLYNLDGIDIDWETPDSGEESNYVALMQVLYAKVKANNKYHLVTTATSGASKYTRYDFANSINYIDYVNIMTYDLHTSGASNYNSPIGGSNYYTINKTYKNYITTLGLNPSKLIIGIAFYGLKYTGTDGIYKTATGVSKPSYSTIYTDYISQLDTNSNLSRTWDDNAKCYYIYDSENRVCVTYDEERSIDEKIKQAHTWGFAGAMYWQDGQDRGDDLVTAMVNSLNTYY